MDIKAKITIMSLVFVLSTIFFWLAINEYLLPSKAQLGSNIQIVPHAQNIECNPQGECYLHILGSVDTTNAIAGVSGTVYYGEGLKPVRLDKVGLCATSDLGLDAILKFQDDPATQSVSFSIGALKKNEELKGGNGCITTVVFLPQPASASSTTYTSKISLGESNEWQAGGLINGQVATFVPQTQTDPVEVSVDPSVPIPSVTVSPSTNPTTNPSTTPTPTDCRLNLGDCNCDSTIDLIDWEVLRSSVQQEGGSCDINGDGTPNALDISIWIANNDLITN